MSSILFYSTRVRKMFDENSDFLNFFFEFFWSPLNFIVPKNVIGDPLGVFEHPFICKREKMKREPFGDI